MRVLFVSPTAELGGAERCLLDCVAALRQDHPEVGVNVLALSDGPLIAEAQSLGAATQVIVPPLALTEFGESAVDPRRAGGLLSMISSALLAAGFLTRLRDAIVSTRPDIVHTNGMKAHLLAGAVAPHRSRLVIHLHDFIGARRASSWLLPLLSRTRRRAVFLANSNAVAEDFTRLAPRADVRILYNVVDTDYFCPGVGEPASLAASAHLDPPAADAISFGLVATYARWKGHALFIEAAGRLRAAHPNLPLRFYVVGGPIYRTVGSQVQSSELLQRAREARIEACFGLVPFQQDIAPVYRALDVVVHASTNPEPFGRTIIEAMACQRAVLVSNAGGATELFQHGENAYGYESGNPTALVAAMAAVMEPQLRSRLGRCGRHHAVANFGRARLAPELLQTYRT